MQDDFKISMAIKSPSLCELTEIGRLAERTIHNLWEEVYKTEYKISEPDLYPEIKRNPINKMIPFAGYDSVHQDNLSRIIHAQATTSIERLSADEVELVFGFTDDNDLFGVKDFGGKHPYLRNAIFESCLSLMLTSAHALARDEFGEEENETVLAAYAELGDHLKNMLMFECGHSSTSAVFALSIEGENVEMKLAH